MYDILHDLIIDASAERIFHAVSEPRHLNNWWTKKCSGIPKIGSEYRLFFSPEFDWRAEVSISQFAKHFELKMTKSDEDWDSTKFGFILTKVKGGILLSHTQWKLVWDKLCDFILVDIKA